MVEIWDEELEKKLGEKICDVCRGKLEIGRSFILKEKKFFHERCYREKKAEEILGGTVEIEELVDKSEGNPDKNISKSSFGEN